MVDLGEKPKPTVKVWMEEGERTWPNRPTMRCARVSTISDEGKTHLQGLKAPKAIVLLFCNKTLLATQGLAKPYLLAVNPCPP
jgi:hypothetical protein